MEMDKTLLFTLLGAFVLGLIGGFVAYPAYSNIQDQIESNRLENITELEAQVVLEGTGEGVQSGQIVTIHYTSESPDGTKIDSSKDTGIPLSFTVGAEEVAPGLDQGVLGMKLGEVRILNIPGGLVYKISEEEREAAVLPTYATQVYEVELIKIE